MLTLTIACASERDAFTDSGTASTVYVITTLYPIEYFAKRIGGEGVIIENIVGTGIEAHSFEPAPSDIRKLDSADVVIFNGLLFEPWITRSLAAISQKDRVIINVGEFEKFEEHENPSLDLPLMDHSHIHHKNTDLHIWLDPVLAKNQVQLIQSGLVTARPDAANTYETNAAALMRELDILNSKFAVGMSNCVQNNFVTSHNAFGHLSRRYGLNQIPISGLTPEAEPGAKDLASIANTIRGLDVKHIMIEPMSNTALAKTLAREMTIELLTLHPLESLTHNESNSGEDYFSIMETNLKNLRTALECV